MRMKRAIQSLFCLGALALAANGSAAAQPAEDSSFKGKSLKLIVGYSSGGGYDVYARMIAPYIGKVLGATVIVENQPGAGGITALDRLYAAAPDGLQIMLANGTASSMAQLSGEAGVRYDLTKFGHLGMVSASPYVWSVTPSSPIKTPADAIRLGAKLGWGATGPMDGLSDGAAFTCEALKLDCKIILGYPSTNDAALAVTRGEMDALYCSDPSANSYVKAGSTRAVATMSRKRSRFFPDLPTIFEAVDLGPEQQWLFDFRSNVDNLGRILIVPPGMAPARLAFLQQAMEKVLNDPALIAEGEKTQRYVDYEGAETVRKMAESVLGSITPEQKTRIKQLLSVKK